VFIYYRTIFVGRFRLKLFKFSEFSSLFLTINAPLILIVGEVIFYAGKTHKRQFREVF
jgi:hypothetical protein